MGADTQVAVVQMVDSVRRFIAHTTPAALGFYRRRWPGNREGILAAQRASALQQLEPPRARLVAAGVTHVEAVVIEGAPDEEIVRLATEGEFDLRRHGHARTEVTRHYEAVDERLKEARGRMERLAETLHVAHHSP